MNNSRFSFIKKNDTLYLEIESCRPRPDGKRRENMKETKNRAARDIIVVGFALFIFTYYKTDWKAIDKQNRQFYVDGYHIY